MKRILHTITTLAADGAQTLLIDTARRLDPALWRVTIAYLWGSGELAGEARKAGVEVIGLSAAGRPDPLALPRLTALLRRRPFDLVHTHLVHAGIVARTAVALSGRRPRQVTTRHYGREGKEGSAIYRLEDRLTRRCDCVVAVSEAVRSHLVARGIVPAEKVVVIKNGIDLARFPAREEETGGAIGSGAPEEPVVGTVGRLHIQKGQDIVLEAAVELRRRWPALRVELVGEGPLRPHLERQARALGLGGTVRLLGRVQPDRIPEILRGWDLFLLPSRWEGFGIAAVEAMAAGRPVVATDVEGLREIFAGGEAGVLVPADDAGALAREASRLLGDPGLSRSMGRAGRQVVEERYRIERAAGELEGLYARLLDEPTPRRAPLAARSGGP